MTFRHPHNSVGIMIYNNCDIFMPLLVAGFIDADVYKVIKSSGTFRFKIMKGTVNASADSFPVYSHKI